MNISVGGDDGMRFPDQVIGSKTGLVSAVTVENRSRDLGSIVTARLSPSRINRDGYPKLPDDLGAVGKGESVSAAMHSAVGEFVERYCTLRRLPPEASREGTYREMAADVEHLVEFEFLTPFAESQYDSLPAEAPTRDDDVRWLVGTELFDGRLTPLPVWLAAPGEPSPHGFPSSNGCAAGESPESAAFGALTEVIERDAVMRCWYDRRQPEHVDVSDVPAVESLRRRCEPAFGEIHVLRLESPIDIPVLGAAFVNDATAAPKFLFTAAAHLRFDVAARQAIAELVQALKVYRTNMIRGESIGCEDTSQIGLGENVQYYLDPSNFSAVRWLVEGKSATPELSPLNDDSTVESLRSVVRSVEDASMTPVVFDFTTPDVEEVGVSVLKACIPELLMLCHPQRPPAGHPALDAESLERGPHPFG